MSAVDFRHLAELGGDGTDRAAYWAVAVEAPTDARPIRLEVNLDGQGIVLQLDYSEAGELFDTLAQALGIVVAAHGNPAAAAAVVGLEAARDTPRRP